MKYGNFTIEKDESHPWLYNVSEIKTVVDEDSKRFGEQYASNVAYGVSLRKAIHIVGAASSPDDDLKEHIQAYLKCVETLKKEGA